MLHTTKPADYIPIEKLAEPARCPECNELLVVSAGVLHLGHYHFKGEAMEKTLDWAARELEGFSRN